MAMLICALIAVAAAGFSRGFAAFGTAMIYVPVTTMAYDAQTAAVTLFLIDLLPSLPLVWKAVPQCDRRTVFLMAIGAIALTPLGVMVLLVVDQSLAQLIVGLFLLLATAYMLSGRPVHLGVGSAGLWEPGQCRASWWCMRHFRASSYDLSAGAEHGRAHDTRRCDRLPDRRESDIGCNLYRLWNGQVATAAAVTSANSHLHDLHLVRGERGFAHQRSVIPADCPLAVSPRLRLDNGKGRCFRD
jgi:hypothetical protein